MTSDFCVYVHSRLSSGEPFYVGKGRRSRHCETRRRNAHWNNIVAKDGGFHSSVIVRGIDNELAQLAEIELINKYRRIGVVLANLTDGGEGITGLKRSPEFCKRLGDFHRGKTISPEARAKISLAGKGRPSNRRGVTLAPEVREKIAVKLRGKKLSPEHKANVSRAMRGREGRPITSEQRAKMVAGLRAKGPANKGQPCSDEQKAKISATCKAKGILPPIGWNRGKKTPPEVIEKRRRGILASWAKAKVSGERKTSPETRAKMSASAKKRWARK